MPVSKALKETPLYFDLRLWQLTRGMRWRIVATVLFAISTFQLYETIDSLHGGQVITASITNEAVDELKLVAKQKAYVVIKASDVMVGV